MTKRIGELLIDAGCMTEDQLEEALKIQRRSGGGRRLGEILVETGAITMAELVTAAATQVNDRLRRHPVPSRLGETLVQSCFITPLQLEAALLFQAAHPGYRIGEVLVALDMLKDHQLRHALETLGLDTTIRPMT